MTRDEIRVLLDQEFRRMFYDKTIDGFKVDDHWYIDFDRKDILFNIPGSDDLIDVNVRWFQNLVNVDVPPMVFRKSYADGGYRKYDDGSAINIDDYRDIPGDYDGVIGVSICFINKLCRRQFDILDLRDDCCVDGEYKYSRIFIKRK